MEKNYCIDCGKRLSGNKAKRCAEFYHKYRTGRKFPSGYGNKTILKKYCIDCGKEISLNAMRCRSCSSKGKPSGMKGLIGIKNPNYQGNKCTFHKIKNFNKKVLERENYTCQFCGFQELPENKIGRNLMIHVHHGNNQKDFSNEIYDENNGFCLCRRCHFIFHSKLRNNNLISTIELTNQFIEGKEHFE